MKLITLSGFVAKNVFSEETHICNLKPFLEEKYLQFNTPSFISCDPIAVPHLFIDRTDIEIAGFLTATISWGRRQSITAAGKNLVQLMGSEPARFVKYASTQEFSALDKFVYRTFNGYDAKVFLYALKNLYADYGSLENAFFDPLPSDGVDMALIINRFKKRFFCDANPGRSGKHLPDPLKNSAAKRINMFLRWMVRKDNAGVDFGIWNFIAPAQLIIPLDLHSGAVARKLGLLSRRTNDWKAALELTKNLQKFDPIDPIKYDFALFGMGWYEKFR